jgi:hypothetical protein
MIQNSIPNFIFITFATNMNNNNHDEMNDTAGVDISNAEVADEDTIKQGNASESILT